ncbi:hypothetical protein ILUMI_22267 [Ignelater luminosus]|uniref:Uncharacterized protein n=1 Tax=Ignelater luminosus TaxID=2038154 RepID=A0A8K0CH10_IGNLU|nr:hypothetical protein ILUMI_22267 [Ignelater luminosus]
MTTSRRRVKIKEPVADGAEARRGAGAECAASVSLEELVFSQKLETTSQGTDVMDVISQYFGKHGLMWQKLIGFCTDGAPATLGLAALIKKKNPYAITTHCVIHR